MIRSAADLRLRLGGGDTVRFDLEAPHYRVAQTDEVVRSNIVGKLIALGELVVIQADLTGDPMQWGAPQP